MKACINCEGHKDDCFDPKKNTALKREVLAAKKASVPENYIKRVIQLAVQGYTDIEFPIFNTDWSGQDGDYLLGVSIGNGYAFGVALMQRCDGALV